jgi:hypothetical protein
MYVGISILINGVCGLAAGIFIAFVSDAKGYEFLCPILLLISLLWFFHCLNESYKVNKNDEDYAPIQDEIADIIADTYQIKEK